MDQKDLPSASVIVLNNLIGSCDDYYFARKLAMKNIQVVRGKIMVLAEILEKSKLLELEINPKVAVPLLTGTKRKVDEEIYHQHIMPLIKKFQGMIKSRRRTRQLESSLPL